MKVTLIMAITANGMIGRDSEHLSLDWTSPEDKKLFVAQTKAAGCMIMGRKTFNTIGRPLPGRLITVMTKTPEQFESIAGKVEYTADSPETVIANLAERGFAGCIIAGGAQVNTMYMQAGVIDEMLLSVEPIVFGSGVPLFAEGDFGIDLKMLNLEKLNEHTVLLRYQVLQP